MTSMRALHVFPSFDIGGSQMRFAMLTRAFDADLLHNVIALDGRCAAAGLLPAHRRVNIVALPSRPRTLAARLSIFRNLIAKFTPDVLLTYNWGAIEWALANLWRPTPHIHFEDGFGQEESDRQLARRIWTRRVALNHSTVVVPSVTLQKVAVDLWRVPARNVRYIPNGLEPRDRPLIDFDFSALGIPAKQLRIVWVGALRPEKNPLRLLRAFARVATEAELIVIGDGPQRDAIIREATRLSLGAHVHMLGYRSDARDIIMGCDIMVLSSDTEQMPFSILEGMDAGLAIAAVDVGDVRRMVSSRNRPFIVPRSDDALASALQKLVINSQARAEIGAENRKKLRHTYHIDRMIRAYRDLFDRACVSAWDAHHA